MQYILLLLRDAGINFRRNTGEMALVDVLDTTKDAGSGHLVYKRYQNITFPTSYICAVSFSGGKKNTTSTHQLSAHVETKLKEQGHPRCIGNLLSARGLHLICIKNTWIAPAFISATRTRLAEARGPNMACFTWIQAVWIWLERLVTGHAVAQRAVALPRRSCEAARRVSRPACPVRSGGQGRQEHPLPARSCSALAPPGLPSVDGLRCPPLVVAVLLKARRAGLRQCFSQAWVKGASAVRGGCRRSSLWGSAEGWVNQCPAQKPFFVF